MSVSTAPMPSEMPPVAFQLIESSVQVLPLQPEDMVWFFCVIMIAPEVAVTRPMIVRILPFLDE